MAIKTPSEYKNMEYRSLLFELVLLLKPKVYVELGVKKCWTFNKIAPLVKRAIAVDINYSAPFIITSPHIQFYQMTTEKFSCLWKEKIDLLFIDADHKAESVLNDVKRMTKFLHPYKSIICLHDTHPIKEELLSDGYCSDAWRAAHFIRVNMPDFEIVTLPGPWAGFSILRYAPGKCHGWMDY